MIHPEDFNATVQALAGTHRAVSWGDRLLTLDKSAAFLEDKAFARAFESVKGGAFYDQYGGPHGIAWRLNTLVWAGRVAMQVGGDFVECGVYGGDMSWVVAQTIGAARIPHFWLYDSFAGFSPDASSATDFPEDSGFHDSANATYREDGLHDSVCSRFASYPNISVIRGFLPESFDLRHPERIGYLHIDLNSPRAEVAVLERAFDRVVPGGIIVFDDYGWRQFRRQKDAEDVFMRSRGHEILELPSGQGLVVKRA